MSPRRQTSVALRQDNSIGRCRIVVSLVCHIGNDSDGKGGGPHPDAHIDKIPWKSPTVGSLYILEVSKIRANKIDLALGTFFFRLGRIAVNIRQSRRM